MNKNTLANRFAAAVYQLTQFTEDPTGLDRPLWRDISKHQGNIDFDIMKAGDVYACFVRSGISWGYKDPRFDEFWAELARVGILRTSYHVIYPDQPVRRQVDNWYQIHPETEVIPRAIDLEVQREASFNQIADATWEMSEFVKARDGMRPIIYTRAGLVDTWLASWDEWMLNDHWWWLAQYLYTPNEHPGPPTLPSLVQEERVILHQSSGKKPGFPGEVQSAAVDWDRWELGDYQDMLQFVANTWGGEEPPLPSPDPIEDEVRIEIEVNGIKTWVSLEEFNQMLTDI